MSTDLSSLIETSQHMVNQEPNARQSVRMTLVDEMMSGEKNEKEEDLLNNMQAFEDIPE